MESSIIIKNVLPEELFHTINDEVDSFWKLNNESNEESTIFWGKDLDQDNSLLLLEASSIIRLKIMKHIRSKVKLCRIHTNGMTSGQYGALHSDFNDENYFTFLLFANLSWNINWGGEFVCINPFTNGVEYCPCIPNTGCLVPSVWEHYGKSPNPITDELRITIAFSYCRY
jgi:hypothetical protein